MLVCPPTFGMYAVAAHIQGAKVIQVPLRSAEGFSLDVEAVLAQCTSEVKLVFLCSPNNPTGNLLNEAAILKVVDTLAGRALVVVDEAYIEFSSRASLARSSCKKAPDSPSYARCPRRMAWPALVWAR